MYRNRFRAVAAAGLQTTPRDLARFGIACMPSFRSDEAKEVLSDALLRTSLGRAPTIPGNSGYALGTQCWNHDGLELFGHTGGTFGWITALMFNPVSGYGIVMLSNGTNADRFMDELEQEWSAWVRARTVVPAPRGNAGRF